MNHQRIRPNISKQTVAKAIKTLPTCSTGIADDSHKENLCRAKAFFDKLGIDIELPRYGEFTVWLWEDDQRGYYVSLDCHYYHGWWFSGAALHE